MHNPLDFSQYPSVKLTNAASDIALWLCKSLYEPAPAVPTTKREEDWADNDAYWVAARRMSYLKEGEAQALPLIYFSKGQCHALALAIHELTGWTISSFGWEEYSTVPNHIFVIAPDGRGLDINGLFIKGHGEGQHVRDGFRYEQEWVEVTAEQVHSFCDSSMEEYYEQPNMELARVLALKVLADVLADVLVAS